MRPGAAGQLGICTEAPQPTTTAPRPPHCRRLAPLPPEAGARLAPFLARPGAALGEHLAPFLARPGAALGEHLAPFLARPGAALGEHLGVGALDRAADRAQAVHAGDLDVNVRRRPCLSVIKEGTPYDATRRLEDLCLDVCRSTAFAVVRGGEEGTPLLIGRTYRTTLEPPASTSKYGTRTSRAPARSAAPATLAALASCARAELRARNCVF